MKKVIKNRKKINKLDETVYCLSMENLKDILWIEIKNIVFVEGLMPINYVIDFYGGLLNIRNICFCS